MIYKECEESYYKWEHVMSGQIFIDSIWQDIIDIEEDAHRGWICETSEETIELSNIEVNHIRFPKLD